MNSKRLYYSMLAIIGILIAGLIAGAYEADRVLQNQSLKLMNDRLQVAVLSQEQIQLAQAKKEITKYQGLATIAKSVVPQDKNQAQAIREIVNIADANQVTLGSITFPSSTLGASTGQTSQVPAASIPSNTQQFSQLIPVKGIPGVYNLQLTIQSDSNKPVAYSRFISFLGALEQNRRTALVNSVTIMPNDKDRSTLSFTLVLDEYIKP